MEALEEIVPFISYGTVGRDGVIELGMALEASGRPDKALDIYRPIKQSGDEAIRKQAKQLSMASKPWNFSVWEMQRRKPPSSRSQEAW